MSRLLRGLATTAAGALVAAAALVGLDVSRRDPASRSEPLALAEYCRHLHGDRAGAYQPADPDMWRCSTWRNGVWGLERVDLAAACRWQRGPDARAEAAGAAGASGAAGSGGSGDGAAGTAGDRTERPAAHPDSSTHPPERAILCTV